MITKHHRQSWEGCWSMIYNMLLKIALWHIWNVKLWIPTSNLILNILWQYMQVMNILAHVNYNMLLQIALWQKIFTTLITVICLRLPHLIILYLKHLKCSDFLIKSMIHFHVKPNYQIIWKRFITIITLDAPQHKK